MTSSIRLFVTIIHHLTIHLSEPRVGLRAARIWTVLLSRSVWHLSLFSVCLSVPNASQLSVSFNMFFATMLNHYVSVSNCMLAPQILSFPDIELVFHSLLQINGCCGASLIRFSCASSVSRPISATQNQPLWVVSEMEINRQPSALATARIPVW